MKEDDGRKRFLRYGVFEIVLAALCAGLTIFLTVYKVVFAFPILPYLKFELAEIPVVMAFLVAGPFSGLLSSVIYWIILTMVGEWTPIGPLMKFLAVASTILGLWAGFILSKRIKKNTNILLPMTLSTVLAIVARVVITSLMNFLVLWWLFPFFLNDAAKYLKATIGFQADSPYAVLLMTLVFTAVFNILHSFFSIIPSYYLVKAVVRSTGLKGCWFQRIFLEARRGS
ncbi:MAG: ECF transporter S component [Thermoproteota archaeon]